MRAAEATVACFGRPPIPGLSSTTDEATSASTAPVSIDVYDIATAAAAARHEDTVAEPAAADAHIRGTASASSVHAATAAVETTRRRIRSRTAAYVHGQSLMRSNWNHCKDSASSTIAVGFLTQG